MADEQKTMTALATVAINLGKATEALTDSVTALNALVDKEEKKDDGEKKKRDKESKGIIAAFGTAAVKTYKFIGNVASKFWNSKAVSYLRQGFSDFFSKLKSTMMEILGPLGEYLTMAKNMIVGTGKFFLNIFSKTKDPTVKVLSKIFGFLKKSRREDKTEEAKEELMGKKKGGKGGWTKLIMSMLLGALFVIGAIIGGLARKIVLPFQILWSLLKVLRIPTLLTKIPIIGKFFVWLKTLNLESLRKAPGIVGKFFRFFTGKGGFIVKLKDLITKIPIFGKMIAKVGSGFLRGFKMLGWPLTIILGLIDFIKGFISTEGDLIDKIIGGIKGAVMGFIEMPVRILGWIVEKVMKLFGVEIDGGAFANKILGAIGDFFDGIRDNIGSIFSWVKNMLFDSLTKFVELMMNHPLVKAIRWTAKKLGKDEVFENVDKWIEGRKEESEKRKEEKRLRDLEKEKEKLEKKKLNEEKRIADLQKEKDKAEAARRRKEEEQQKKIAEETELMRKSQEKGEQKPPIAVAAAAGGAGGQMHPEALSTPPDEIDSMGLWLYNTSMP